MKTERITSSELWRNRNQSLLAVVTLQFLLARFFLRPITRPATRPFRRSIWLWRTGWINFDSWHADEQHFPLVCGALQAPLPPRRPQLPAGAYILRVGSWPPENISEGTEYVLTPPRMSHSFIQNCCWITLQVSHHQGRKTCVKNGR